MGGDFTRLVYGNEQAKIGAAGAGNLEEVVMGSHAYLGGGVGCLARRGDRLEVGAECSLVLGFWQDLASTGSGTRCSDLFS